jgi:hypothetical protein
MQGTCCIHEHHAAGRPGFIMWCALVCYEFVCGIRRSFAKAPLKRVAAVDASLEPLFLPQDERPDGAV